MKYLANDMEKLLASNLYKVKRLIVTKGAKFCFYRYKKNSFNEPFIPKGYGDKDNNVECSFELKGVFSNIPCSNFHAMPTESEGGVVERKPTSSILALSEDATSIDIKVGDFVFISESMFEVVSCVNVQKEDFVMMINLEELK